jgi:hypothetical protein
VAPSDDIVPELFCDLARRLRDAHRRVAALPEHVPDAVRQRFQRRLIAISDAAKRDISRAAQRLDAFLADLDNV